MHVPDPGGGIGPCPRRRVALEFAKEFLRIERSVPEAQQLRRLRPLLAWKVPGQLNAVAFCVRDVDREMSIVIHHALDVGTGVHDAPEHMCQLPPGRHQDREVIQSCGAAPPPGAAQFGQAQQVVAAGAKTGRGIPPPVQLEAQDVLVERDLALEVRRGQVHIPQRSGRVNHKFLFGLRLNRHGYAPRPWTVSRLPFVLDSTAITSACQATYILLVDGAYSPISVRGTNSSSSGTGCRSRRCSTRY